MKTIKQEKPNKEISKEEKFKAKLLIRKLEKDNPAAWRRNVETAFARAKDRERQIN